MLQGSAPTQAPLPARRTARVLGRGAARGPASALAGGRLPLSFLEKPRVCWWEAGVGRGGMARGAAACRVGGTGEPPSQEAGASLGAAAASSRGDDSAGQCSASPHVPGHRLGRAGAPTHTATPHAATPPTARAAAIRSLLPGRMAEQKWQRAPGSHQPAVACGDRKGHQSTTPGPSPNRPPCEHHWTKGTAPESAEPPSTALEGGQSSPSRLRP